MPRMLIALTAVTILTACAGSKMTPMGNLQPLKAPVSRIAIAPSGGVLADAVGVSLFNQGIDVVDTQQTSNLLLRVNLNELEISEPQSLARLADEGIDAVMFVRAVAGYDDRPQSASVRVISTTDGSVVAGLAWQNGRGGARGSPADGMMRKDIVDAAGEIAEALAKQLRR